MTPTEIEAFMNMARREGKKALPDCLPNPPVGCVIVANGQVLAKGHTQKPGEAHAEAMALQNLPEQAEDLHLFVTLEPCSFQGKTPSCAKAIIRQDISQVYVGIIDPHPKNRGAGIDLLEAAGINVHCGILADEIEKDLAPYLIRN